MELSILMYGQDVRLLDIRATLLLARGYRLSVALSIDQLWARLEASRFDLVILCHSLPVQECKGILDEISPRWPRTKVLILNAGRSGCAPVSAEYVFDTNDGPRRLLSTVDKIIQPGSSLH